MHYSFDFAQNIQIFNIHVTLNNLDQPTSSRQGSVEFSVYAVSHYASR